MYALIDTLRQSVKIYEDFDGIGVLVDFGRVENPPKKAPKSVEDLKSLTWGTEGSYSFDWDCAREYLAYNIRHQVDVPVTPTTN